MSSEICKAQRILNIESHVILRHYNISSAVSFHLPVYYIFMNNSGLDDRWDRVRDLASVYLISMFCGCSTLNRIG